MAARSLLYISNGNIPSRWAHTVQTMKMCEALAELVPELRLLVATSLRDRLWPRIDLFDWYGIARPFPVTQLPLWLWRRDPLFTGVRERRFSRVAPVFAASARPALVWTRSAPVALGCLRRGLPVIFERHTAPNKWAARISEMGASPALRGLVVLSDRMLEPYLAAGIPRAKIGAFPSAVDAGPAGARGDARAARRALGLEERGPLALYTGSLSVEKGLPTLLEAARQLPEVRFEVLGGAAGEVARWREAAPANVSLRGFVPHGQLVAWLEAADVGLFTNSARDPLAGTTSPLKLLEYVRAGLPAIAAAIPAVTSWLRDGENAYLYAPDDAGALAAAIRRALADPGAARACAERALGEGQLFTWRTRAQAILARFAPELLARPPAE